MKDAQKMIRLALVDKDFRQQLKTGNVKAIEGYKLTEKESEGIAKLAKSGRLDSVASQIENAIGSASRSPDADHPGLLW